MGEVVDMCIFFILNFTFCIYISIMMSCKSVAHSDHCVKVSSGSQNLYLANSAFYLQTATSIQQCGRLCLQFTLCKSVSIKDFVCRLNYLDARMYPSNLIPLPGAVYMGKSEIENMLIGMNDLQTMCNRKCTNDRRCVISKSKQPTCIAIDFMSVTNVATGKESQQSSTYSGENQTFNSSLAVDGNYGTKLFIHGCSHTKKLNNPWWSTDLGLPYLVHNITILNRDGGESSRLKDFVIYVSSGLQNINHDREIYASYDGPAKSEELLTFSSQTPTIIRNVTIQMYHPEYLTLCEVSVHASFMP